MRTDTDAPKGIAKENLMRRPRPPLLLVAALLAGAGACSDSVSPNDTTRPPEALNVIRVDETSLPLFNPADSFYAKKGEDRELRIYFQDDVGGQGEEFLRLRVDAPTLQARPDGTPFLAGDSILITVRVVDPMQVLVEMEPTGLTFDPVVPAQLKIHYNHADHDFNEDGAVDIADDLIKSQLAIWRQETLTDPFVRLGSVNVEELEEIDADILSFTRYAIAY
ncbi:MAG TPA: hypothetical protein VFU40_05955 [Gemmatimonadales bacterium]|nr:hypothetical protein [Gemmatimonadales bacterium]